ncbi:MAG: glutathione S-transferase family protein [Ketobacteraceae bacterium]|nr:glutathione S-transferase family protein [Ketobacteraceae bacterium]
MSKLELHQFSRALGLPNPGPFCMKVEAFLRQANIDYTVVEANDPRKAPKGKVPFIVYNGERIGDSNLIIERLSRDFNVDLNAGLSDQEKAIHHAMRKMLDEHLYFVLVYGRWMDDQNWAVMKNTLFSAIPRLVRGMVTGKIREKIASDLQGQGIGKHRPEEIYAMGIEDVDALTTYLSGREWFGNGKPCLLDISAVTMLASFLKVPLDTPVKSAINRNPQLVKYVENGMSRLFG